MTPNDTARALALYLDEQTRRDGPFDWATRNCAQFVSGWVAHITGRDPMEGLPATANVLAAQRLMRRLGGSLAGACTRQLGVPAHVGAMARVGDVVLVPCRPGTDSVMTRALGLCAGRTVVCLDSAGACHHLPLHDALQTWHLDELRGMSR